MPAETSVRFRGDLELISEIEQLLDDSGEAEVIEFQAEEDSGTGTEFGIEIIATVVGLVSDLFFDGPIVPALVQVFRKKPGSKITIETPRGSIVVTTSGDFTKEQLRKIVDAAP
jgi:hypothetical protein